MTKMDLGKYYKERLSDWQATPPQDGFDKLLADQELQKFDLARRKRKKFNKIAIGCGVLAIALTATLLLVYSPETESRQNPLSTTPTVQNTSQAFTAPADTTPAPSTLIDTPRKSDVHHALPPTETAKNIAVTTNPTTQNILQHTENVKVTYSVPCETFSEPNFTPVTTLTPKTVPATPMHAPKAETSNPDISVPLIFSHDTTICANNKLSLYVKNAQQVYWNIGLYNEQIEVYPEQSTRYVATATKFNGKDTTIVINVNVIDCKLYIPNAFSPNGDGLNDLFLIQAPDETEISHFELSIFETSGRLIFHTKNMSQGWDGTYQGKMATQSAYLYIVTYKDKLGEKHIEKGQVFLYR